MDPIIARLDETLGPRSPNQVRVPLLQWLAVNRPATRRPAEDTVRRWFNRSSRGPMVPPANVIEPLGSILGVRASWIVTGDGPKNPDAPLVALRPIYEIRGSHWTDPAVDAREVGEMREGFWRGLTARRRTALESTTTLVRALFQNVVARALIRLGEADADLLSRLAEDHEARGRFVGIVWRDNLGEGSVDTTPVGSDAAIDNLSGALLAYTPEQLGAVRSDLVSWARIALKIR